MKKLLLPLVALATLALGLGVLPSTSTATGGDSGWSCPAGTDYVHKYDGLSGKTWTVPQPPAGWTVLGASLKVGGPGGGSHIDFAPVSVGDVLDVSYQKYDISHAHLCKGRVSPPTTTEPPVTTAPPTTAPPTTEPPATTEPPVETTEPPATTAPPTTEPPVTTEPPTTTAPPTTEPPATTTTEVPCRPEDPCGDPDPCEWDENLPAGDPNCVPPCPSNGNQGPLYAGLECLPLPCIFDDGGRSFDYLLGSGRVGIDRIGATGGGDDSGAAWPVFSCYQVGEPPAPTTTTTTPPKLPTTGGNGATLSIVALGLLAAGTALVAASRRPQEA